MALLGRHGRAFAVGDAATGFEGGSFAFQREFGCGFAAHRPGVKQVEFARLRLDVHLIGQARSGVFCGKAGNVVGRLHRALDRRLRKVRGAGIAPAVPHIHRHAQ